MFVRTALLLILMTAGVGLGAEFRTQNIVLVTADGLRWQDVFAGMDPLLEAHPDAGMEKAQAIRDRFNAPTPEQRRRKQGDTKARPCPRHPITALVTERGLSDSIHEPSVALV